MHIKPYQWVVLFLLSGMGAALWMSKRHAVPAAAIHSSSDTLQLGQLTLQSCEIGSEHQITVQAYCTEFVVPENHADANSRQIKLKVAVVKSEAAQPDSDLVTFIDGG